MTRTPIFEVYRDQLGELERDAARGLIATAEAEQARRRDRTPYPEGRRRAQGTSGAGRGIKFHAATPAWPPCSPCRS